VDASDCLIQRAKAAKTERCEYLVGDARRLSDLGIEGSFDAATCVMALMNIEPLSPVMSGVASLLRPGGRFVAVMLHPAFRSPGRTTWGWDGQDGPEARKRGDAKSMRQYRRIDAYLSEGRREIVMNPGEAAHAGTPVTTATYHRPLQAYVSAFAQAGLLIDAMEEWASTRTSEPGPRAEEENRARREIPVFLALRAVKQAPAG
jgi:SAM-dependent methyltransferase